MIELDDVVKDTRNNNIYTVIKIDKEKCLLASNVIDTSPLIDGVPITPVKLQIKEETLDNLAEFYLKRGETK